MHLGIKNFVGSGGKKSLFGDGTYSQNIVQGGSVLQPQASSTAVLGNIAATGTFSITGTQWNGGAYPATQIFNGVNSDWGILDAVANSSFNWDFGRAVEMQKVRLLLYGGAYNAHDIYAEYSDNGVAWSVGNHIGYPAQDQAFHDYALGPAVGAHRYWRLRNASTTIFELSEVQWIEQVQLQNCIVITGAATVAPDATTGASVFTAQNVLIDGGTLAPSTNSKGLIGIVSESIRLINGGGVSMTGKGVYDAAHPDTPVLSLVPVGIGRKLKSAAWSGLVLKGAGASGAAARTTGGAGLTGAAGGAWMTGGGGSGGVQNSGTSGRGGCGGPFSGGPGGGGITNGGTLHYGASGKDGQDYGGHGGDGWTDAGDYGGGGAGNPGGKGTQGGAAQPGYDGATGAGGVLLLASPAISLASGCVVQADGMTGGSSPHGCGGGSGGGLVGLAHGGAYSNNGTVRANGGLGGSGGAAGGPGGVGSVNTFTLAA